VLARFCDVDLHPNVVSNVEMGYLYEELVRRFSELTNESAGEHFTPREVIQFMVDLLIADDPALHKGGSLRTLLDPACGTGGMLSVAQQRVRKINPDATLETYGQELNAETFAVCRSDIMVKGQNPKNIAFGNSFSQDAFKEQTFDFLLANPPFGVEWKKVADVVKDEHRDKGFRGRFGAGLPRVSDGSLLFLQHMLSKMKRPADGGSRVAIVFNASPLFTGTAGTGESEIRRWIIENDWLETVVALPDQLFYNTGIATYVWVLTNRKTPERRGSVQLIDARGHFERVRRSLGEKRKEISSAQTDAILKLRDQLESGDDVKILPNESFGFLRITIERPKRLRWEVTADTLARLAGHPKLALLDAETMGVVTSALQRWAGSTVERQTAVQKVNEALLAGGQKGRALRDAALDALSVPDPDAPPMVNDNGDVEPDPALRDYGIVALPGAVERFEADPTARLNGAEYRAAVERYLETDVLPHTSDAWVDHGKTRIGYEIHVTRHFYKHIPARPLETIRGEIQKVEEDIKMLLREVAE
jgi:type I restriction enzyme M protein